MLLPKNYSSKLGFTLIELLVVISILAILALVGLTSFQNVRTNTLAAKRKADIDAIKKAYEANYSPTLNNGQGGYKPLTGAMFAGGQIPAPGDPATTSYIVVGPDTNAIQSNIAIDANSNSYGPTYAACVNLADGTRCSAPTALTATSGCYCLTSSGGISIAATNSGSSCDGYGLINGSASGLVGYWKMDAVNSGTTTPDEMGNGNGTITGAVLKPTAECKFNQCLKFSTASDRVNTGTSSVFNITGDATYSAWIYLNPTTYPDASTNWTLFSNETNNASGTLIRVNGGGGGVGNPDAGKLVFRTNTAGTASSVISSNAIARNSWHHIVVVKSGTKTFFYVDGVPFTTGTNDIGNPASTTNPFIVGSYNATGSQSIIGYMDDVRVYKRALSASEVNLLWNNNNGCF